MAVRCARCAGELIGAVNRCWKCGARFSPAPTAQGEPPLRRQPALAASAPASEDDAQAMRRRAPEPASPRHDERLHLADYVAALAGVLALVAVGTLGFPQAVPFWTPPALALAAVGCGAWGLNSPRWQATQWTLAAACVALGLGAIGGACGMFHRLHGVYPWQP